MAFLGECERMFIGCAPSAFLSAPDPFFMTDAPRYEFFDITAINKRYVIVGGAFQQITGGAASGVVNYGDLGDATSVNLPVVNSPLSTALAGKIATGARGAANGVASLDGSTLIPTAQMGTGTADSTKCLLGDRTWGTLPGGGSGTVTNTGTLVTTRLAIGNGGVDITTFPGLNSDGVSVLVLGVAGTSVGGLDLKNATSGTLSIRPATGALGTNTWTLPAATDTFVGLNAAQTLTNKILTTPTINSGGAWNGSPTIAAPSLTGIVTTNGANVTTAAAMGALAIDVTKGLNTKSISADSTFTFSGTPANTDQWFSVHVTNTDTNPHILTFPSSFSLVTQAARTTCPVPASGQLWLLWRYDGTNYHLFGDGPFLNNFAATANPAVTDDVSKGYGPGSLWGNATANTMYWCESNGAGAAVWNAVGSGGAGTVTNVGNNLTASRLVLANGGVDITTAAGITSDGTSKLTLGVAGTSAGGITFNNATSGSQVINPPTGALGTQTFTMPNIGSGVSATIGTLESLQNSQSAAYTLVLTDSGKTIYHPSADTTARTWTIPANSSVAFPVGTMVAFDNDISAGTLTIAITTDTLVLVGAAGASGSRTLAAGGRAVAQKVSSTRWRISGSPELT